MSGLRVVHVVCTDAFAGVERYVHDASIAHAKSGAEVHVIGGSAQMGASLAEHGVAWNPGASVPAAVRALRAVDAPDVIVTHMTAADIAARVAARRHRTPIISVRHFAAPRGSNPLARPVVRAAERRIVAEIAVSDAVAAFCRPGATVVRTGAVSDPASDVGREHLALVAQRLEPEKHTADAIRAWALAAPAGWRLIVAGSGSQEGELHDLARELGVDGTVEFIGFSDDIPGWLRRASLLIAPTPNEGLGLAVVEAMAHGVPVVASAAGGHLETVGAVSQDFLFAPHDIEGAAFAITELVANAKVRETYGAQLQAHQRAHLDAERQWTLVNGAIEAAARAPRPAAERVRLVVCSLEPWDEVWRRNQHLLDRLVRADETMEVLFVEPPADPLHALATGSVPRWGAGLRLVDGYRGRLHTFQPTKYGPRALGPAVQASMVRQVLRAVKDLGWDRPLLWVNDPTWVSLLDTGWPSLYDVTDDWADADRPGRVHDRIVEADRTLLGSVDAVVVCSPELLARKGGTLVRNGVDMGAYRRPTQPPADLPTAPTALYVGTLHEDRLDIPLLLTTASELHERGACVVLVGPDALAASASQRLRETQGIVVLGRRPAHVVPDYLRHADALIVPHLVNDFTDSLDPIKLYEYLAAGRPIVSTPVAGFRDHNGAQNLHVCPPIDFPDAVARTVAERHRSVVPENVPTWDDRASQMREVIDRVFAGVMP